MKNVLKKTGLTQLVIVDTEGVSGEVSELNIRNWKVNLFILLMQSDNIDDFAKSINKMKPVLLGNNIWYAVTIKETTLPSDQVKLLTEEKKLEDEAKDIKEDFSKVLSSLDDPKSLLNMKVLDLKLKDNVLAIPNIKLDEQYAEGRRYIDKKLAELLTETIIAEKEEVKLDIDARDFKKKQAISNLFQLLIDTSKYAVNNYEINNQKPKANESIFKKHIEEEHRLQSYDNAYLIGQQWRYTSGIRQLVYNKINEIRVDVDSPLNEEEQAAIVQMFYKDFARIVVWTNTFLFSKDKRENTDQASIILMFHAKDIVNQMNINGTLKDILANTIKVSGWEKNYFLDENVGNVVTIPIIWASEVDNWIDEKDKFYRIVIRPYTLFAIYYTALKLGYKNFSKVIDEVSLELT